MCSWCSTVPCSAWVVSMALSNGGHLLLGLVLKPLVVVGFVVHDGDLGKVFGQRRRLDLPLQAGSLPGIVACDGAVLERPREVDDGQKVSHTQHGSAGGGEHVK